MTTRTFTVTDSFVIPTRGTVLVGPRRSEVGALVAKGDALELTLDGKVIRTRVQDIEEFLGAYHRDLQVGILLADDIGKVPSGTLVRPAE